MRFLLLNQFYPPDTAPTGKMLRDLGKVLAGRGHEVRVVCSRHGYEGSGEWSSTEFNDGIQVVRTAGGRFRRNSLVGRFAAYGIFLLDALRAALTGPAPETVVSLTTPPFLGIAGAVVARLRGSRHAHWTMDVYPDALRAHWGIAGNRFVWPGLQWLGRAQFRRAVVVVAPGSYVEHRLRNYVPPTATLRSVPLWATDGVDRADPENVANERRARGWGATDLIFMYSGNMGLGHRFTEFLEAARRLGRSGPAWVFVGNGPRKVEIERFRDENPGAPIQVLPHVDSSRLSQSLASADVHLVSVALGWEGVMVPSKVQNAFAIGRPVIFLGPTATEVATWIQDSGGGWSVTPGDTDALIRVVGEASDPAERRRRGLAAMEYARLKFDRRRNCEEIATILEGG